jgi:hypothetical protein
MTVNDVRAWIRKTATPEVLIAFVLGLVLGLVVLGWWLWPVQWTNADPVDLRANHRDTYLQMIADSFALNGNTELARSRLEELMKPGQKDADLTAMITAAVQDRVQAGKAEDAGRLQRLVTALNLPPTTVAPPPSVQPASTRSGWLRILGILFFLALLGAGLLLLLVQLQRREPARRRRPLSSAGESLARLPEEEHEAVGPPSSEGAFAQFEAVYQSGDEAYDVSYSVESATGEFLGECGVSALEKEAGTPGKFTAFDIWLFDKLDSRTETAVLMSERAFADEALKAKLADRREFVQAEKGKTVTLETENLLLYATVTDLDYEAGSDAGVFARLATKLDIVPKERTV